VFNKCFPLSAGPVQFIDHVLVLHFHSCSLRLELTFM